MAGLLCAVALFAKLSAIWGVGAIGLWLCLRNRRALGSFLGVYSAASGLGFLLFQLSSGGRFLENILTFSSSGIGDDGIRRIPSQFEGMAVFAPVFYVLLPLAVIECVRATRRRDVTIYHLAFPFAAATLIVVLTRSGAVFNHFLDLLIISAVLTARLWTRWRGLPSRAAAIPIAVMLGMIASYPLLGAAVVEASSGRLQGDVRFLDRLVHADDRILSEDASIPIAKGQVPVVLDAFLLPTIGARDPDALKALVDRVEGHEFDRVILVHRLDDGEGWYKIQFGTRVANAIERNYFLLDSRENYYYVYAPRPG